MVNDCFLLLCHAYEWDQALLCKNRAAFLHWTNFGELISKAQDFSDGDHCVANFKILTHAYKCVHASPFTLISQHQNPEHQRTYFCCVKLLQSCHHPVGQFVNMFWVCKKVSGKTTGPTWVKFISKVSFGMAAD